MTDTTDNQIQDEWDEETVHGPSTVIAILDQIENLIEFPCAVSLSASIMVNKAETPDLFDQAHEALPEDLVAVDAAAADADVVLGRADPAAGTRTIEANLRAPLILDQANECVTQILADAGEEAEHTRSRANDEATVLVSQACSDTEATTTNANAQIARIISIENIVRMAEDCTHEIVSEAKRSVTSLCEDADGYMASSLDELAHLVSDLAYRADAERRTIAKRHGADVTDMDLTNE